MNRYFELIDPAANHRKFWEVIQDGTVVNARFGRIGTQGQTQVKTFNSVSAANQHVEKMIREKRNKGYQEVAHKASGAAAQAPLPRPAAKPKPTQSQLPVPATAAPVSDRKPKRRSLGSVKKQDDG